MYYDTISQSYEELYGEEQLQKARIILEYIAPRGLLLDVGAGTGICTKKFELYCTCIALDPSSELLKKYNGFKVLGVAEALPFPDNSFDTIISITVLHHTYIQQSLKEIFRVAKKDAQIAITILKKSKVDLGLFVAFKKIDIGKDWLFIKNND